MNDEFVELIDIMVAMVMMCCGVRKMVMNCAARERGLGVHFHFLETEWELGYIRDELKLDPERYLEAMGLLSTPLKAPLLLFLF